MSSSVSKPICGRPSGVVEQTVPAITYPETPQEVTESKEHSKSGGSKDDILIRTYESPRVAMDKGLKKTSPEMEETIPYVERTIRETPFIDFMLSLNPPVRVSTVYAGRTTLLSERDNQMLLLKLDVLEEAYGTNIFAVDKVTAEVYSVLNNLVTPIGLQGYEEPGDVKPEGAVGFNPCSTSTPRKGEVIQSVKPSEQPSDLSTILEQSEAGSRLTRDQFLQNRKQFKEVLSILSASEITKEITREQVDRAYKKKVACSQRITMIFQNWNKEKELVQNDLERERIDQFYKGYHAKYAAKLLSWQDVIDMYCDQELQKIQEEKEMKEKAYYDQKSRERKKSTVEPTLSGPTESEQTRLKGTVITEPSRSSVPHIHTETRTVSSAGTVSMPTTHRSQYEVSSTKSLTRQRELS